MYSMLTATKSVSFSNVFFRKLLINQKSCGEINKSLFDCKRNFFSLSSLNEIKKARNKVVSAETKLFHIQEKRKQCQEKLVSVQNQLREIHAKLPKLDRGDQKYLDLSTKEYDNIIAERNLSQQLRGLYEAENASFVTFSTALSESNDKQITRMENAKKRPLMLAAVGLLAGLIGTSAFYHLGKDDSHVVGDSDDQEYKTKLEQLLQAARTQYRQSILFLSDLQSIIVDGKTKLPLKLKENDSSNFSAIDFNGIKRRETTVDKDIELVKKLLDTAVNSSNPHKVVRLGTEVSEVLDEMEGSKEWPIKKSALSTVLLVSGTGFVGIAVVYLILSAVS